MKITRELITGLNPRCSDDRIEDFLKCFPKGNVTLEACRVALDEGYILEWLARKIKPMDVEEAITPANKAYQEAITLADKAYQEAITPVDKAYQEAITLANKAYRETMSLANKAYQQTLILIIYKVLKGD